MKDVIVNATLAAGYYGGGGDQWQTGQNSRHFAKCLINSGTGTKAQVKMHMDDPETMTYVQP